PTMSLPPFLDPLIPEKPGVSYLEGVFDHQHPFGRSQVLWWAPRDEDSSPSTIAIFIPGTLGLTGFYASFLSALHTAASASSPSFALLAHTHLGFHGSTDASDPSRLPAAENVGVTAQVEALLAVHDALLPAGSGARGPRPRIVLIGHSIGAWLATQVLRARPGTVDGAFLLFPTLSDMAGTPRGRTLWPLFRRPVPRLLSLLAPLASRLPLARLFPTWPAPQLAALRAFVRAPGSVYTCLTLADHMLRTVRALDVALLRSHAEKLRLFYAERDGWVGAGRAEVERALVGAGVEERVVGGRSDVGHAFCVDDEHGELVAAQCLEWLREGGYLSDRT
ncbi:hypothetical protein OF83DRAFT_1067168, partial [Amylostereum chailletii]